MIRLHKVIWAVLPLVVYISTSVGVLYGSDTDALIAAERGTHYSRATLSAQLPALIAQFDPERAEEIPLSCPRLAAESITWWEGGESRQLRVHPLTAQYLINHDLADDDAGVYMRVRCTSLAPTEEGEQQTFTVYILRNVYFNDGEDCTVTSVRSTLHAKEIGLAAVFTRGQGESEEVIAQLMATNALFRLSLLLGPLLVRPLIRKSRQTEPYLDILTGVCGLPVFRLVFAPGIMPVSTEPPADIYVTLERLLRMTPRAGPIAEHLPSYRELDRLGMSAFMSQLNNRARIIMPEHREMCDSHVHTHLLMFGTLFAVSSIAMMIGLLHNYL